MLLNNSVPNVTYFQHNIQKKNNLELGLILYIGFSLWMLWYYWFVLFSSRMQPWLHQQMITDVFTLCLHDFFCCFVYLAIFRDQMVYLVWLGNKAIREKEWVKKCACRWCYIFYGDIDQSCDVCEQGEQGVAGQAGLPGPFGPKVNHHHL